MVPKPLQRRYVAYYRVSTQKQGRSGLGLEAQRHAVQEFITATHSTVLAEFKEVESGAHSERPALQEAIRRCRLTRSTLLVAKLDRLSRNAAFLLTLRDSGVRFLAADIPDANELTVGVLAVVAEQERRMISERTKAAMAAARRRGVKLGNPDNLPRGTRKGAARATRALQAIAQARAEEVKPIIEQAQREGCETLRELAAHLNELGVTTARGGQWNPIQVSRVLERI
jgi:DNA invertase Pin-like site-specific DNA recombinase